VVVTTTAPSAELAADALWQLGATAVEERVVGPQIELRAALGDDEELLRNLLKSLHYPWRLEWVDLTVADTWRQFAQPVNVGEGLRVVPAWLEGVGHFDGVTLLVEPGSTFGLGNHPTTIGCLRLLKSVIDVGDRVLDVGTGSGVLAIAAVRLGASQSHGTDINPASPSVGAANAALNDVADRVSIDLAALETMRDTFDVVVANILAPVLIELSEDLVRLSSRVLIVSGLLADRYEHVLAALHPLRVARIEEVEGWVALALTASGRLAR
jgi:ribosomal protein L11 methyltransferase